MRRVVVVAALVLLAGAPACAHPSRLGAAPAYPAYGPAYGLAPYAAAPRHWSGGGHHRHAVPRHHHHGHSAPQHGHHRPHHGHRDHHRRH